MKVERWQGEERPEAYYEGFDFGFDLAVAALSDGTPPPHPPTAIGTGGPSWDELFPYLDTLAGRDLLRLLRALRHYIDRETT